MRTNIEVIQPVEMKLKFSIRPGGEIYEMTRTEVRQLVADLTAAIEPKPTPRDLMGLAGLMR